MKNKFCTPEIMIEKIVSKSTGTLGYKKDRQTDGLKAISVLYYCIHPIYCSPLSWEFIRFDKNQN